MSNTRNNLSHRSQQIISIDMPEGYIESPMWVGAGTRLLARLLLASYSKKITISSKFENLKTKISNWQTVIDEEPITFEGIKADHNVLKEDIHSLYQGALYA